MQERAVETHDLLLDTAAKLFCDHGYDATGVAEICDAAGVSKGAFYHHFASKQALFLELLNRWLAQLDEQIVAADAVEEDVPAALRQMGRLVGQVLSDGRGQLPMFLEFWMRASRDDMIWPVTVAPYQRFHHRIESLIERGIAEGSIRPVDPVLAARTLVSLAIGLILPGLVDQRIEEDDSETDWADIAQASVEWLVTSILATPVTACETR